MNVKTFTPAETFSGFAKAILVVENEDASAKTVLPFFADGCPGIIYHETRNGLFVNPHNKKMPVFFLYGQTIQPVELIIEGSFKLIIVQLYPFVLRALLEINPKELNDNCFDMTLLTHYGTAGVITQLQNAAELSKQIEIIVAYLFSIFQSKLESIDFKVQQAIQLIVANQGQLPIKEIRKKLNVSERTFERRFIAQAGVSPKQFSKIIRFQVSLNQLTDGALFKLTDIVFENGFADQSHFIRAFKYYTGKTPKKFHRKARKDN